MQSSANILDNYNEDRLSRPNRGNLKSNQSVSIEGDFVEINTIVSEHDANQIQH